MMDDWQRPLLRWLLWNLASTLLLWIGFGFLFGRPQSGELCNPPDPAPDGTGFVVLFIIFIGAGALFGGGFLYATIGKELHLRSANAWAAWLGWIATVPVWVVTVAHTINIFANLLSQVMQPHPL